MVSCPYPDCGLPFSKNNKLNKHIRCTHHPYHFQESQKLSEPVLPPYLLYYTADHPDHNAQVRTIATPICISTQTTLPERSLGYALYESPGKWLDEPPAYLNSTDLLQYFYSDLYGYYMGLVSQDFNDKAIADSLSYGNPSSRAVSQETVATWVRNAILYCAAQDMDADRSAWLKQRKDRTYENHERALEGLSDEVIKAAFGEAHCFKAVAHHVLTGLFEWYVSHSKDVQIILILDRIIGSFDFTQDNFYETEDKYRSIDFSDLEKRLALLGGLVEESGDSEHAQTLLNAFFKLDVKIYLSDWRLDVIQEILSRIETHACYSGPAEASTAGSAARSGTRLTRTQRRIVCRQTRKRKVTQGAVASTSVASANSST